mmetsp:Transcript_13018/g.35720  ORF Transcript_13018/g.35720 Transcript_13018/m.35720 type:complete len:222 (-) Transcript_13018:441-1106(-)
MLSQRCVRAFRVASWPLNRCCTSTEWLEAAAMARPSKKGPALGAASPTRIFWRGHAPGASSAPSQSPSPSQQSSPWSALWSDAAADPPAALCLSMQAFQTSAMPLNSAQSSASRVPKLLASSRISGSWSKTTGRSRLAAGSLLGAEEPLQAGTDSVAGTMPRCFQPSSDASSSSPSASEETPARESAPSKRSWRCASWTPRSSKVRRIQPRRLHFGVESCM